MGPVAGVRGHAPGSVTHSPESQQLFELRAGLGGPTPPGAWPRTRLHPSGLARRASEHGTGYRR